MRLGSQRLETARLTLRELTAEDLDFVAELTAHPEVMAFWPSPFDRRRAADWLDYQLKRYQRDGHGFWLVEERRGGRPVGFVGLLMQQVEGQREPEIGYMLHRPYWGLGYATEAAARVREAAFGRWRYDHVISLIQPANAASRRVAERLGMRAGRLVAFHGPDHIVYRLDAPSARSSSADPSLRA